MSTSGVPDILSHARLARLVGDVKSRTATASREVITGRHEDVGRAVSGDTGGVHLLNKAVADARAYQKSLALAGARTSMTQNALSALTADSREIAVTTLGALNGQDAPSLKAQAIDARTAVHSIFGLLNTTEGGRAIFSGDAVDRSPLGDPGRLLSEVRAIMEAGPDAAAVNAALDEYFNDPDGGFATDIYNGGEGAAPPVEIAPGVYVQPAVKADAPPIRDLIRNLAVIANYEALPAGSAAARDSIVREAALGALDAETALTEMRASIGVAETRMAAAVERYALEEAALATVLNARTARDPFEAAAELQKLETQLESSYLMTARLARLSLVNFLR